MNIILIGNGSWGKNYVSTIHNSFPTINLTIANRDNWKNLIDSNPDGVIIATPPDSHIEIASYALEKNIATMIEKPLSLSIKEAKTLQQYTAPILVNHIHLFSEGYQKLKKYCPVNAITEINSNGYGTNLVKNYSSLWDYGPHDLSMILDIMGNLPNKINVYKINNIYTLDMNFNNGTKTRSIVGSGATCKARDITINYDGIQFMYDDIKRPQHHKSPLENALHTFISSIDGKLDDRLGLSLSFKILEVLEYCQNFINM